MPRLFCQPHEGGALGFEERMAGSRWSMVQNETAVADSEEHMEDSV